MKFHIVRNQETTKEILQIYSLSINELKEVNRHVRDWNKLIPGTKLKIPIINEAIEQDIIDMEPFVEDYYPRNDEPLFKEEQENQDNIVIEEAINEIEEETTKAIIEKEDQKLEEEKIKDNNINQEKLKDNFKQISQPQGLRNISYVWYQPYPVYYPIYIKVK